MTTTQNGQGYRLIFCKCFKHWRSGKLVYRKNGGYFCFRVRC